MGWLGVETAALGPWLGGPLRGPLRWTMGGSPSAKEGRFGWATERREGSLLRAPKRQQLLPLLLLALVAGGLVYLEEEATPDDYSQPPHYAHVSGPRRAPQGPNEPWPGYGIPAFYDYYSPGPPSRPELGRATWTFLHAVATNYPEENVTDAHVEAAHQLMKVLATTPVATLIISALSALSLRRLVVVELCCCPQAVGVLFPCKECAGHLRDTLEVLPVRASSADEFKDFMCRLHSECRNGRLGPLTGAATLTRPFLRTDVVNDRLEKPRFDCRRVDERWQRSY